MVKVLRIALFTYVFCIAASAAAYAGEGTVTLLAVGDNLIHKSVYENQYDAAAGQYDFNSCYDRVRDDIQSHDIAVINQETIFVSDPALYSDYPAFGIPFEVGDAIVNAGFDVVLSASNHSMDKGIRGINDTINYWRTCHPEIRLLGINDSQEKRDTIDYIDKNGIRFAMFNYTFGLNGYSLPAGCPYPVNLQGDQGKLLSDISTAEQNADFTIVFLHIGEEYHFEPTSYQRGYINSVIDAGADLVICAHPHVVEPFGMVTTPAGSSALVYYSCGNFLHSQTRLETLLGGMADVTIQKKGDTASIISYSFIPVVSQFGVDPGYQVIKLDDYTDEMAMRHYVYANRRPFTAQDLRNIWNDATTGR